MTKLHVTAYKDTGKFYTSEDIECPDDIPLHDTKAIAELVAAKLPLLENGFIHIQDNPGGAGFHDHLFRANELRTML